MRFLIINFHSCRNAGDLSILEQTTNLIKRLDPLSEIKVTINDPVGLIYIPGISWLYGISVCLLPRYVTHLLELMVAFIRADVILSIGGGYFYSTSWRPMSIYNTLHLAIAVALRKNILCLPQSIGPFQRDYQREIIKRLLKHVNVVMAREEITWRELSRMGLRDNSILVPDTAFLMPSYKASKFVRQTPFIGMTILDWQHHNVNFSAAKQANYENIMRDIIMYAHDRLNANICLFIQCRGGRNLVESDMEATQRVAKKVLSQNSRVNVQIKSDLESPLEYQRAYGQMDIFVATRLHSAIFALSAGVPVICIGYLPKSNGIMKMMSLENYLTSIDELRTDSIVDLFDCIWSERYTLSHNILLRYDQLHEQCNHELAVHIIAILNGKK